MWTIDRCKKSALFTPLPPPIPLPLPLPLVANKAILDDCWILFGVQSQLIGTEGGKLCLQPSGSAMRGKEGEAIFLEVPPGAVRPSENVMIDYGIVHGPFTLPEGYQLGSMVVYIHYNGKNVTRPFILSLPHWYDGEDHVKDGLSFAMAPHTLKEGEHSYRFELLAGGEFAEQPNCGLLQISGHCTLFTEVFKFKAPSSFYASLWTYQVDGNVINSDNKMHCKVVITYAAQVWIEVSDQYTTSNKNTL